MKKFNKVAMVLASAALASAAGAQSVDNWRNSSGTAWKTVQPSCAGAMPTGHLLLLLLVATVPSLRPKLLRLHLHQLPKLHQHLLQGLLHLHQPQLLPQKSLTLQTLSLTLTNQC